MAINDLIPGSLGWMLFNMRSVHPVYDASSTYTILTDDNGNYLTDDNGNYLTSDTPTITLKLVRWA